MEPEEILFGPVKIIGGEHQGRIGYYDDEDTEYDEGIDWDAIPDDVEVEGEPVAIVYFGDFSLLKVITSYRLNISEK